jgi:hypothetical protein
MGQQQLLLLVLGIVIVGLAVVAGINAFEDNQQKSEKDALVNEAMRIATDVQANVAKPSQLGGGGGTEYPSDLTQIGYSEEGTSSNPYTTPWGDVEYTPGSSSSDGELKLLPKSVDQKATINIPQSGSPQLATSGGTWSSTN